MADGKRDPMCNNMTVPINMVRLRFIKKNDTADVLHLLRWILFYLRTFCCTVHPYEGHGFLIFSDILIILTIFFFRQDCQKF